MGGEPTFISLDDRNGREWTSSALSPEKRRLAVDLLYKLRDRFSCGALLHFGQGKWYPGEQLPRWALGCYWRKDGVPFGKISSLFAEDAKDYGYGAPEARKFLEALTRRLQVSFSFNITAYEDVFFNLWKERRLPPLLDPLDPKLKDFPERARLAQIFEEGAEKPIGFVLPLRRIPTRSGTPRWTSQPWFPLEPRMFLSPGDSPMGYRLPLEAMPWTKPEDLTYAFDTIYADGGSAKAVNADRGAIFASAGKSVPRVAQVSGFRIFGRHRYGFIFQHSPIPQSTATSANRCRSHRGDAQLFPGCAP